MLLAEDACASSCGELTARGESLLAGKLPPGATGSCQGGCPLRAQAGDHMRYSRRAPSAAIWSCPWVRTAHRRAGAPGGTHIQWRLQGMHG